MIALLLVLALAVSLCMVWVTAEETGETPDAQPTADTQLSTDSEEEADGAEETEEAPEEEPTEPEEPDLAGPDKAPETDPETGEIVAEATIVPDELGKATFANVERRMRENNLQVLTLQESVDMLESIDYDDLKENLRKQLNSLAQAQWYMVLMGQSGTLAYEQMDQAYDAVREQFDDIKDGKMQEDNAGTIRQLKNLQDQIILAGESTYIALAAMDIQEGALQRQLAALDRTVEEMELRYQLGQVSALQLSETKAGRTALVSGLETLQMNSKSYKYQLELLLGAEMTGEIALGTVPAVTAKKLAAMDEEADLLAAKEKSYELFDAANTLADAQEDFKDNYSYSNPDSMTSRQAKHTWQAAQYTYNSTVQDYERRFRVLYAQVKDYQQIWEAAKVSLNCQQEDYAASELKYQQGTISKNTLLSAKDDLTEAEEKVQSAANDLFSAYNTYCWAVENGILN
jgi:hypothetical protein